MLEYQSEKLHQRGGYNDFNAPDKIGAKMGEGIKGKMEKEKIKNKEKRD